jgi:hypothetical protein
MIAAPVLPTEATGKFHTLTCLAGKEGTDPFGDEIIREVAETSLLGTIESYMQELRGNLDNNAPAYAKLAYLFDHGITPTRVEGHFDGVAIGLRTGDEREPFASYGNVMEMLWSTTVGPVAPWVGKSFLTIDADSLKHYTDGHEKADVPTYLGINHFTRLEESVLNRLSFSVLSWWMHLKDTPEDQKKLYGQDRDGGLFIARRGMSAYAGTKREVFQLNYRWPNLGNLPPFTYLIDEVVEISEGAYLGQLLFATHRLLQPFDADLPATEYGYQHFGYFLITDATWAAEIRRVFHNIRPGEITAHVAGQPSSSAVRTGDMASVPAQSLDLTLNDRNGGNRNEEIFQDVQHDLAKSPTIVDLLKSYSDDLLETFDNRSPSFLKLNEIFNRGLGPDEVRGFYHGALISFHSEGLFKLFDVNTLDLAWKLGRYFSPWTGKIFTGISRERLAELTDGFEKAEVPTFFGSNTYAFRTAKEKIVGQLMKAAPIWTEPATADESTNYGYSLKSFFFIGHKAASVNPDNKSKQVFQFNYRWPKLRTLPPDNYCIDELVKIADGLYLGQLIYATELLKKYDPNEPSSAYNYRLFGYFLLLDERWNRRRTAIGLDPYNG